MTNTPLSNFYNDRNDTKVRGNSYDISERYGYDTLARNDTEVRDDVFVHDNASDVRYNTSVHNDNSTHYETSIRDTNDTHDETYTRDENETHEDTSIRDEPKARDEASFRDDETNKERDDISVSDNTDETSFRDNDTKAHHEISARDDIDTDYETSVREHNDTLNETSVRDDNDINYDTSVSDDTKVPYDKVSYDTAVPYNHDALVNNDTTVRHNTLEHGATNVRSGKHFDAEVHNEVQNSNNLPEKLSPGTRLRQVREQNNLSIKYIADQLYLDIRVIEALEADNYNILPPPFLSVAICVIMPNCWKFRRNLLWNLLTKSSNKHHHPSLPK